MHEAERQWRDGGSVLSLVQLLADRGEVTEAGAVARAALERDGCLDAAAIEQLLFTLDDPPADWDDQLRTFSAAPTVEAWRSLMRFVPPEPIYQRIRNTIRRLEALGVDGDMLFLCSCELVMTPDAIRLVEEGRVAVGTIEKRSEVAGGAQATYLGLAAIASFLSGDIVGAIRFLRESAAHENEWCSPFPAIVFIREHGSDEVILALDRAGFLAP